jgi:cyclase
VPTGYEVVIDGGRQPTGRDALAWSLEGERLGAGELCINSIDRDGTKSGYDLEITRRISESVSIPVVASGGAGRPEPPQGTVTTQLWVGPPRVTGATAEISSGRAGVMLLSVTRAPSEE